MVRFGSYVIGEFVGIVSGNGFSSLHVKVGPDSPDRPGFTERMNVRLFDQNTGARVVPVDLDPGDLVAVLVIERVLFASGGDRPFVAKTVLGCWRLSELVSVPVGA